VTRPARRLSLAVQGVESSEGGAVLRGEVWLGPVVVGSVFTAASDGMSERPVSVRVVEISEPPEAQEVGRVARVVVSLTGDGVELLRPGVVLVGEARNPA